MNWRVVVAVIVAFVIGGGAGAVAEHERLKHDSNTPASTSKATTTNPTAADDWFGARTATACPTLKEWLAAAAATYAATINKSPWASQRTALLAQIDATSSAYRKLEPLANSAGKAELAFLLTNQKFLRTAVAIAGSSGAYLAALRALTSARSTHDVAAIVASVKRCSTA